jgi:hypothetical protein
MKALGIVVFVALAFWALPAWSQGFTQPMYVTPDGQKKVGQYIWVWHTARISKSGQMEVEADCPVGYVVLGGGYFNKAGIIQWPHPNEAFDGWVVNLVGSGYGPGSVTVYASCAPAS